MLRKGVLLRRSRWRPTLLVLCGALLSPAPTSAQGAEQLEFLGVTSRPIVLTRNGDAGRVRLLLRNASAHGGRVRIRFHGSDGLWVGVGAVKRGAVRLEFLSTERIRMGPRSLRRIGVRLQPAPGSTSLPAGTLVAELVGRPGVAPASVALAPPAAEAPKPGTFYQDAIEVTVTRGSPFGGRPEVVVPLATPAPGTGKLAEAKLLSGEGHEVDVTLEPPSGAKAKLTIGDIPPPGKYSGKLRSADERAADLGLTVHVQDWILYPILAIFIGVVAGGFGGRFFERWRGVRVIEKSISELRDRWRDQYKPPALAPFDFAHQSEAALRGLTLARRWPWSIDKMEDATEAVDAFVEDVTRWLALAQALAALEAAATRLAAAEPEPPSSGPSARRDTEALLTDAYDALNGQAAESAKRRIDDQVRVVDLYVSAIDANGSPAEAYAQAGIEADRSRSETRRLIDELERLGRHRPRSVFTFAPTSGRAEMITLGGADSVLRSALALEPAVEELRPPEVIARSIRRRDLLMFLVQSAVIAVPFIAAAYSGQDFGGPMDYALAFAAGFAGKVAVPWELLFRGTRPVKPASAS